MVPSFTGEEILLESQPRQCPQCGYNGNQRHLPNGLDDSRVEELTNCNVPPNDAERIRLEEIYREGDAYMSILEERITTTRATLDRLIDEQQRATQEIARSKRLLNPIRRIPTEILSTIFVYCSQPDRSTFLVNGHDPVDEDDPSLDSLDPSNMPWVLTYVCSRWRQIVLNASELWVHLRLQFDRYDDHLRYLGALVKYLSRAGKRGIQVHLESTKNISVHPLLAVLMASSSTWLDFCVSIPYDSVCALNAVHGSLQNLESVGIQVTDWPDEMESLQSWTQNWTAFQFAPKLSSLTVYGSEGIAWPHIPLPWHSLTYLDLMGKTQQAVSLISTAHSLQSCYLGVTVYNEIRDVHVEPYTHLTLQSLDITSSSPWCSDSISTFFEHFTFPALTFLRIDFYCFEDFTDISMPTFTTQTAPMLTELHVDCLDGDFDDDVASAFCELLKCTPALKTLHVAASIESDTLFLELGRRDDDGYEIVRNLEILDMSTSDIEWHDVEDTFMEMLESRRAFDSESISSFQTLRLAVEPDWGEDGELHSRWRVLMDKGLDVEVPG